MAIDQLFSDFLTSTNREHSFLYDFDGSLEEYLTSFKDDSVITKLLRELSQMTTDMRVCVNFRFSITHNVTNQIIRYKDAFKIPQPALVCPVLLYGTFNDREMALILVPDKSLGYIYAKGLYYILTEPEGLFDGARNHMAAFMVDEHNVQSVLESIQELIQGTKSLGSVQRFYDRKYIKDIETMKTMCMKESQKMFSNAFMELSRMEEDRGPLIYETVANCFLLKKSMYVQFMMNKTLLDIRYQGNIKKQRQDAKQYADGIPFISYSELWRAGKDDPLLESEVKDAIQGIFA
ncbi:MAG: hypothetical protein PUF50_05860 [Erysipelotrichaceae bacterium]|nr:hypothetical protein [Erysipelotrichaceae bacterium]